MPLIADCRTCHNQADKPGRVQSDCVMCHSYHVMLELPDAAKRTARELMTIPKAPR